MKKRSIALLSACLLSASLVFTGCGSTAGEPAAPEETAGMTAEDEAVLDDFLENFAVLAAVPRQSGHEQQISDTLKAWAEAQGYEVRQNEVGDLFFDVPATEGYENLPLTALQAHMDMVCTAESDKDFDPLTDPITVIVDREAGTMTADGTSLGADDGAGVAVIMSIVKGGMAHGPLRIILTVNEEVTMGGAMAVTAEDLDGVKYLVNIDSEDSKSVTVSTAADSTIVVTDAPRMTKTAGDAALSVEITGLEGGHSGVMIGEGRCNGMIALAKTLTELGETVPFQLVSFTGGSADNAIPDQVRALIVISSEDRETAEAVIAEQEAALQADYEGVEDGLTLSAEDADMAEEALEDAQAKRILGFLTGSVDGVYTMSSAIEGLVESSSNLGQINVSADGIEIREMPRSSAADKLTEIEDHQTALARECGLDIEIIEGSRPWPYKADSTLVPKIREIYREQNGEEIQVVALHAALECGAFSVLSPELDMASIGPDLTDVHSPDETLYLDSVLKTWHLLEALLVSLD